MPPQQETIPPYQIASNAQGRPIELKRAPGESVCLVYDDRIKRLVELHRIAGLDSVAARSALERAQMASEVRCSSLPRVLDAGERDGVVFYTTTLNDGELVEDYIERRGALPPATVFCLALQLLDDLVQLQTYPRLVSQVRLNPLLVTTLEDTFLQFRVLDPGLHARERRSSGDEGARQLTGDICQLIFLLLTGKTYAGENPDRYPATTCLPTSLRATLRNSLADPSAAPASLERLRDEVREAFAALVSSLQVRNTRKHLVVAENQAPKSHLQSLLLEDIPVTDLLAGLFTIARGDGARRIPFSIPATHNKTGQDITVHLLPPSRIIEKDRYEAVPLQMWRFDPQRHPNILRSTSLWEGPDWTFLTEEREPGFPLSRLIAERIVLNPAEVLVILRQVAAGLDQAVECGVRRVDLHPSNMLVNVGKPGPMQAREFEKLMLKRVDAWPPFRLKLRPHLTMRSLYEPLLLDSPEDAAKTDEDLAHKDFRNRSFVALAVYLLTGERQIGRNLEFPETVPAPLAACVREAMEACKRSLQAPSYREFLDAFEKNAPATTDEPAPGLSLAALRGTRSDASEMQSVGSVSDFDDDPDSAVNARPALSPVLSASRGPIFKGQAGMPPRHDRGRRSTAGWLALTASIALLLGLGWWGIATLRGSGTGVSGKAPEPEAAIAAGQDQPAPTEADSSESAPPASGGPVTRQRAVMELRRAIEPSPEELEELKKAAAAEAAQHAKAPRLASDIRPAP